MTPVSFYLTNGMTFLGARILGGSGDLILKLICIHCFLFPSGIVSGLAGMLAGLPSWPTLAGSGENLTWLTTLSSLLSLLLSLGITIYPIILTVRSLKVAHHFTTGKAVVPCLPRRWSCY